MLGHGKLRFLIEIYSIIKRNHTATQKPTSLVVIHLLKQWWACATTTYTRIEII